MPQSSRTFRLFVSSTFSDLKEERSALQKYVFPRLRELALAHGCRFQAIDLRWGVSEEAALDQQTMKICLTEIERCQKVSPRPNFLILLGERFGWRPLPYAIPAEEFERLLPHLTDAEKALACWREVNGEPTGWYRLDENAVPQQFLLQPRVRGSRFEDYAAWESQVERPLLAALERAARAAGLDAQALVKYTLSATGQEIELGAMQVADAPGHVLAFLRTFKNPNQVWSPEIFFEADPDLRARQQALRESLKQRLPGNVYDYQAYWHEGKPGAAHIGSLPATLEECLALKENPSEPTSICLTAWLRLSGMILEEAAKLQAEDALEREINGHLAFAADQRSFFVGREDVLDQLERYLTEKYDKPMGLSGNRYGRGRSAVMAQMVARAVKAVPGAVVVARFIGATPESTSLRALLEGICRQVTRAYGGDESSLPFDLLALIAELPNCLALATPQRPLILLLDGLNQLSDEAYARGLEWLPVRLPPHVRMVVSTMVRYDLQDRFKSSSKRVLELEPLTEPECQAMLERWLEKSHRKLNPQQALAVLEKFYASREPLYMRIALEEVIQWKSYQAAPDLPRDIDDLIDQLFNRLAQPENHGETLVEYSVALLAASGGLSEDELLELLWQQDDVRYDFYARSPKSPRDVEAMPVVIWARLYADLQPYLAERASDGAALIVFRHRTMALAARYSRKGENKISRVYASRNAEIVPYHIILARYFAAQPTYLDREEHLPNLRKLAELQWQQRCAELTDAVIKTFYDFNYLQARLRSHGIDALINDYNLHWRELQDYQKDLLVLQSALRLSANTLAQNPDQLAEQLFGRLIDSQADPIMQLLQQARFARNPPWLRPLNTCLQPPGSALFFTLAGDVGADHLQLSPDERLVLTYNLDAVKLWDLTRQLCLVTITKEMLPVNLSSTDAVVRSIGQAVLLQPQNLIAISSAPGEITLWDTATGTLMRKLTGHTAAAMALTASGDGKRLVSGDLEGGLRVWDTQKGTCLQVMKSSNGAELLILFDQGRKLLATPIDWGIASDYSLNVWDLQTGTLLQCLEETAPTSTAAISPDGLWAFSGTKGGQLKIWDLKNGTCKNTLQACRGAVETITVLPDSRVVYTGGADDPAYRMVTGKPVDYDIRVWEIATGKLWGNLKGHTGTIFRLVMADDGCTMVSVSMDSTVKVWDLPNWRCRATLHGHANSVTDASFRPHYQSIVTASKDGTLKVWDINANQDSHAPDQHAGEVHLVAITPDGQRAVSATRFEASFNAGDVPCVWDVPGGHITHRLNGHTKDIYSLHLLPDGQHVLTDGVDGTSKVWNLATGDCEKTLNKRSEGMTADGRLIVTRVRGEKIIAWSIEENRAALEWHEPEKNMTIYCLALHPSGQTLLMINHRHWNGTADPLARLVELKSGKVVRELKTGGEVWHILFAPDGKRAFLDKQLWDLQAGQLLYTLEDGLTPLAFTPDGVKAVCMVKETCYRVVNTANGARVMDVNQQTLLNMFDRRSLVCILPLVNGAFCAVTAAPDNWLKVWSLDDGHEICAYRGDAIFETFTASADGRTLACGSADGRVHLLRLENVEVTIPVITAWQEDTSGGLLGMFRKPASASVAFGCPHCRQWSQVSPESLGRQIACPKCNRLLKLAPTAISGDWRPVAQAWQGLPTGKK